MSASAIELAGLTLAVGFIGSFAGGVVGVGAVLMIAPLLYFGAPLLLGIPLDFKTISNLTTFSVLVSSMRAIFVFRGVGLIRREVNLPMAIPSFAGSCVGVAIANLVSAQVVQTVFALASIAGALIVLLPYQRANDVTDRDFNAAPVLLGATGVTVGVVGGLAGAGGGFLLVPLLLGVFRLPTRVALGAASLNGLIIAFVAFAGRWTQVQADWLLLAAVGAGSLLGSGIGTHFQQRVPTVILRRAFAAVVGFSAIRMLVRFG